MAVFNVENLNEGAWFDYDKTAKVKIRGYTNDILQSLRDKYVEKKVEYHKKAKFGDLQRIEFTEFIAGGESKLKADLHDYIIEDWEGFTSPDKKKIPCNKKSKIALMNGSPPFAEFVDRCIDQITKDQEADKETLEKN